MKKLVISTALGSATTFGLFAFMAFLIGNNDTRAVTVDDPVVIDIIQTPEISKANNIVRPKLQPPTPPPQMPRDVITPDAGTASTEISYQPTPIAINTIDTSINSSAFKSDGDARPLVRATPNYPIQAARDGIEGWVQLMFDINEIGEVINVKVVDSKPRKIFNKEATRALRKWKYRSKSVDGVAVVQHGMTVRLDFNMDQSI